MSWRQYYYYYYDWISPFFKLDRGQLHAGPSVTSKFAIKYVFLVP